MKKLFIHHALFRLLSPILCGIIVYLLVLMLNNNVAQIQEDFFNEELYFCIGLSYLIQEFSRLLLLLFKRILSNKISVITIVIQVISSMLLCLVLATIAIKMYFKYILNFEATSEEIYVFNSIFCTITLLYILLYISHQYLYKVNTQKLAQEEVYKANLEEEFKQFKKGINPNLLFQSFESLIELVKNDIEKSEDFIDNLAIIYRYILSSKKEQLVSFESEYIVLQHLEKLLNELPYRRLKITNTITENFLIVPSTLLYMVEQIVKTTIASQGNYLTISLVAEDRSFSLSYHKNDSITNPFKEDFLDDINKVYSIYSDVSITIKEDKGLRHIVLPKLKMN